MVLPFIMLLIRNNEKNMIAVPPNRPIILALWLYQANNTINSSSTIACPEAILIPE